MSELGNADRPQSETAASIQASALASVLENNPHGAVSQIYGSMREQDSDARRFTLDQMMFDTIVQAAWKPEVTLGTLGTLIEHFPLEEAGNDLADLGKARQVS